MTEPPATELDPHFENADCVLGHVTAGGEAVPGMAITIVSKNKRAPLSDADGGYRLRLDPAKYGAGPHELIYSAPGFQDQRHTVTIPPGQSVTLDVDLSK